ncbi:hypothetical protein Pfo_021643 [Paulownia fortunei]|nr:hypothetical protein Pfo_021643 [Paulownia fortunei]
MEESEKRRERLKAMRMEAARAGVNTDSESSGLASGGLSNPFIESENTSATPLQYTSTRFDYYTDPMSAFSGSKRRHNISPQVSQGHYNTPPRPAYQGMTPAPVYQNPAVNSPGQAVFQVPGAHFNQSHVGSSMGAASPLGRPHGNPPSAWGGSGGAFNYSTPPNLSRGGKFTGPGFRQGDSPYVNYGRGRGQGYNSSSHYDSGRGGSRYHDSGRGRARSLGNSMSPGSGLSGRRGAGSRDAVSAELRPDLYYRREMVEDPWKLLTPVIWKGVHALDSDKPWLPKSIGMKKSKVSSEASQTSISQQSLAEYLAASFNEAVDGERGT